MLNHTTNTTINQNDNIVSGDLVAGDKNETHYHYSAPSNGFNQIATIYNKIQQNNNQYINDDLYLDTKEEIANHQSAVGHLNLAEKLVLANKADQIDNALELKESIVKLILRYETSPAAEYILTNLLTEIKTKHNAYVQPAVLEGATRREIDMIIDNKIVEYIKQTLNGTDYAISSNRIYGLIYFLAGNCHIRWDNADLSSSV